MDDCNSNGTQSKGYSLRLWDWPEHLPLDPNYASAWNLYVAAGDHINVWHQDGDELDQLWTSGQGRSRSTGKAASSA